MRNFESVFCIELCIFSPQQAIKEINVLEASSIEYAAIVESRRVMGIIISSNWN